MLLREIFNTKPSHKWDEKLRNPWFDSADVNTNKGDKLRVNFYRDAYGTKGKYTGISFDDEDKNNDFKLTNKGGEFEKFAKVLQTIKDYTNKEKPERIGFSSVGPKRTKLYRHFINKYAKDLGYDIDDIYEDPWETNFVLKRRQNAT
jgi:hypothetical protein